MNFLIIDVIVIIIEIAIINHGRVIANDRKENLMKILPGKELIISATSEISDDNLRGLASKRLAKDKISITYDPEKIEVEEILRILCEHKIHIKDISTQQPDLEEVFKHLIRS